MIDIKASIYSFAKDHDYFRFSDLFTHLNSMHKISKVTLSWYIRGLLKDNTLFRVGRGIYTIHVFS